MKIFVDLISSQDRWVIPTKNDIQNNIDALNRAIDGKPHASDFIALIDTLYILKSIQKQLPEGHSTWTKNIQTATTRLRFAK